MSFKPNRFLNLVLSKYHRYKLKNDQWKDSQRLKTAQFRKLRAIIKHAYDHVPYYHRLLSSSGTRPESIQNLDDLRKIPLTSKQNVRKNFADIIAKGLDVSKMAVHATSGSTGVPLKVVSDNSSMSYNFGSTEYVFSECGVKPTDDFVTIWGGVQSIVSLKPYVRILGGIKATTIPLIAQEKLIKVLRRIDPDVIQTFPSVLSSLANYDISGVSPRLIFTQGEVVDEHCRGVVRKMFNLELLETYASVEFGLIAFECERHCGLHTVTSGVYIELVAEDGECVSPGEQGEIVVTGLHNLAMPLIRYRIGDKGILSDEKCACGRSWPLIKSIQGRINDYLVLPSGRKVSWMDFIYSFHRELAKNVFAVSQYQMIQDRENRIIFKVVKGKEYDPLILKKVKANLETHFAKQGEEMDVDVEIVEEIPVERTGKRRFFISKLS